MSNRTKNETAPVAPGTASEPKNPTVEAKAQESAPSVDQPNNTRKLLDAQQSEAPADGNLRPEASRVESNTLVEQVRAEYERTRPLRAAMSRFGPESKPMLSDKGPHPIRYAIELDYWQRMERRDLVVSPWLADWENSLERADWTVIRRSGGRPIMSQFHREVCDTYPQNADLFCPKRGIYLTLVPSKLPMSATWFGGLEDLYTGYPASLVIMHAREREKHFFQSRDCDFVNNLLSAKNTARCIDLRAVVEFNGMLYEPDAPADENGESMWHECENVLAWEVYHDYRSNSLYYHEDQSQRDNARTRIAKLEMASLNPAGVPPR